MTPRRNAAFQRERLSIRPPCFAPSIAFPTIKNHIRADLLQQRLLKKRAVSQTALLIKPKRISSLPLQLKKFWLRARLRSFRRRATLASPGRLNSPTAPSASRAAPAKPTCIHARPPRAPCRSIPCSIPRFARSIELPPPPPTPPPTARNHPAAAHSSSSINSVIPQ